MNLKATTGKGIIINTRNISELMNKISDDMARSHAALIDFEIFFPSSPRGMAVALEAERLNARKGRNLSLSDMRTRGAKYYAWEEEKAFREMEKDDGII